MSQDEIWVVRVSNAFFGVKETNLAELVGVYSSYELALNAFENFTRYRGTTAADVENFDYEEYNRQKILKKRPIGWFEYLGDHFEIKETVMNNFSF